MAGCPVGIARKLVDEWFLHTDFLLHDWSGRNFDFVVGNPPYVRLEDLSKRLLGAYRTRFETATERADLYVPFFELGLELLSPTGRLAYICANRFAKNKYGAALRQLIARKYHVRAYLNLEHTQPFEGVVSAYPAIVILDREPGTATAVSDMDDIAKPMLDAVADAVRTRCNRDGVCHFLDWHVDGSPWILKSHADAEQQAFLARLPLLEESAPETRVGIGVATGADQVFVCSGKPAGVEAEALLPLVQSDDIRSGVLKDSDSWLLNPYRADGSLRDDTDAPGLMRLLRIHEQRLRVRHCAKKSPERWYRTIDRIWPQWVKWPKLLMPDIQSGGVVAFDSGRFYPHHNVYWIISGGWNLRALQTLLRSEMVTRQIRAHSVQMRGGAVRCQTQTLRKIRVPAFASLDLDLVHRLAALAESKDMEAINRVATEAFHVGCCLTV